MQRRDVSWDKVPCVPRPSLIADPITAFGKKKTGTESSRSSILDAINREAIKPDPKVLARPIGPYISARDKTREKVSNEIRRKEYNQTSTGGKARPMGTEKDSMDILLPRLHGTSSIKEPHKRLIHFDSEYMRF